MDLTGMEPDRQRKGSRRAGRYFLLGSFLGLLAVALVWHFYPGFWKEDPAATLIETTLERREVLQSEAQRLEAQEAARASAVAAAGAGRCEFEPMIAPAGSADGQARTEHPFPAGPRARAKVFTQRASDAATAGRPRDAEIALLAACQQHELASRGPNAPLARVLGLLGDHYVAAAAGEASPGERERLIERARQVLTRSADAYAVALGPNASRSRAARRRVEQLEQEVVAAAAAPGPRAAPSRAGEARIDAPNTVRSPRPASARREGAGADAQGQPADRARPEDEAPPQAGPSDPELRQLASDLARLRAQAEAVSRDPAGLRQRAEMARARREQCRDAACLRDWYARRRRELLAEF